MSAPAFPVCVLGSVNVDIVLHVPTLPRAGETIAATTLTRHPGGKGANQAVAARRMGATVAMLGAIGDDEHGREMRSVLDGEGIDTQGLHASADAPTGTAYIAIDEAGENQIMVAGGANQTVGADLAADAPVAPAIRLAQLETPVEAVAAFFASGAEGTRRILNAAPAILAAKPLFTACDIVVVNESELAAFAGATVPSDADDAAIVALARKLIERYDQTIIVTLGAQGALAVSRGEIVRVPARRATVVDTTGAGDCFCGVLAASLAEGLAIEPAMHRAVAAAARAVERAGAIPGMPFRAEIDAT